MAKRPRYRPDPIDGRRALEAGIWAQEKHDLLARYIEGTRYMRGKFSRSTYTELFCGPGRVWFRDRGPYANGSALRAWEAAKASGQPFEEIFINDLDAENVTTCKDRLEKAGATVTAFNLPADKAAPEILKKLGNGVHLALLDPFGISALPFSVVQEFAKLPKMDLVINYAVMDVQRNLLQNLRGESDVIDEFCPGWRKSVSPAENRRAQRGKLLTRWLSLLESSGIRYSREMPLVRGTGLRAPFYHLVFGAHNDSPLRVWGDIANTRQGDIFAGQD
jgi:three-Cys-motif partner protein